MSPTTKNNNRSTNDERFPCSYCNKLYLEDILEEHEAKCVQSRTCPWCLIVFKNGGNLASHTKHLHRNKELRNTQVATFTCSVCDKIFINDLKLKYHIREKHYNLKTRIASRDAKRINQVWFERVLNSDVIVEISKRKHNILLIRKYGEDADGIEVNEDFNDIDLSNIYPKQSIRIKCEICNKIIVKKSYKKHLDEKHNQMQKKHQCSNCNKSFSRLYFYVKHVCNKRKNPRRGRIVIDKVESQNPILVS